MTQMLPVNLQSLIGETLYGFCNGFFGRDSYEAKTIEAIGKDWIVARTGKGELRIATFEEGWKDSMLDLLKKWGVDVTTQ